MKAHIQKVTSSQQSSFVYRLKADPRFARGWHFHPEYELTHIQRSRGRRLVGDSVENYRDGDLVLLGPNLPHTWQSEDFAGGRRARHRAVVIQFTGSFLGEHFFERPELKPVADLLERSQRGLQITGRTRDRSAEGMLAMRKLEGFDRLMGLLGILDLLARGKGDVRTICSSRAARAPDPSRQRRLDRVFGYLHESYTEAISQPEAARVLNMTPSGFSRFFRKTTGKTFVEYLGELRVSHACNLLVDTDLSILQIALRSGFNNLSNFNRRFLKLKGMTPREYRTQFARALE